MFGEDLGGGAVDADLLATARRRGGVGADGRVEAVHVDEAVHGEVLVQRLVARGGRVLDAEVAVGLDVGVDPVGDPRRTRSCPSGRSRRPSEHSQSASSPLLSPLIK